jgi:membrane-associated protein
MIGNLAGKKLLSKGWVKEEHIAKTEKFYQNYGSKTIIIARFVPIVRTIAPFVAGIGKMDYKKFFTFNVAGALCWTTLFLGGGFLFGNIPTVKENLTFVVLVIIVISVIPGVLEIIKARRSK